MAYWTLDKLKTKIRSLTGKPTVNELSDEDLIAQINLFMQEILPVELQSDSLRGYWNVAVSSELVDLPDYVISLEEPMTLDYGLPSESYDPNYFFDPLTEDEPDLLYYNLLLVDTQPQKFFQTWPNNQTWAEDRPYAVLFYGRQLLFRPPPDTTYTFRSPAYLKPDALSTGTDTILRDIWGKYIAAGTAWEILEDQADTTRMAQVEPVLARAKSLCNRSNLMVQGDLMLRPIGRW